MTASEMSKVLAVLADALLDRGIRVEQRIDIVAEVEEALAALTDGQDDA